ncbi:SDR family NAD(P)-dependent oxidoreductase [Geminicoccus harenae]|uniref:SDR family NAD(P)-dependent oxidoreductase n=1 Tax=Geminicoccus harenae TaxID=2498453 RepID=UPI00168BB85D|nr:SDR family oxidoreductase [Geminicoccus harenae]
MRGLSGKRAVVTGAATGIGRATALRLAEEGVRVAVIHHGQADEADTLLQAMRPADGPHLALDADVADEAMLERAFDDVLAAFGGLELLVANAATKRINDPSAYPMADWDAVHGVNLRGAYMTARAFLRRRTGPTGAIVFVSSVHEITPLEEDIGYAASKAGLAGVTRTLALAEARRGVRVNNLAPGGVITPMNPTWTPGSAVLAEFEAKVPLGRAAQPEEMASVAAFLLSDEASYVTGQTLVADGGVMWSPH